MRKRDHVSRSHPQTGRISAHPRPPAGSARHLRSHQESGAAAAEPSLPEAPPTRSGRRRLLRSRSGAGLWFVRYGIGLILILAGVIVLIINPSGFGSDGFGMAAGSGFSVIMLNVLYRIGVTGDKEREREEEARRYLAKHGRWPDESRPRAS